MVLARAHLERYRERVDPADLGAARTALGTVRAVNLDAKDRIDFLMALGEALFFEDDFGAAAQLFESGLDVAMSNGAGQARRCSTGGGAPSSVMPTPSAGPAAPSDLAACAIGWPPN